MIEFPYVSIDTETTGLDPNTCEIIEVSAIEFNEAGIFGEKIEQFCWPISGYISAEVTAVNGITIDMVKGMPNYLEGGVRERIAAFVGTRTVVGHNIVKFDMPFLKIVPEKTFDTLLMCRTRKANKNGGSGKGGNNLRAACRDYNIEFDESKAHRACYDALMCAKLFIKIKALNDEDELKHTPTGSLPMFINKLQAEDAQRVRALTPTELKKIGVMLSDDEKRIVATQAYSFSRINLFHTCPFKWYQTYVKKIKEINQIFFQVGKACHAIAEKCGQWCYRELFANKFHACFQKGGFNGFIEFNSSWESGLKKEYQKDVATTKDMGYYLFDNQKVIKDCSKFKHIIDLTRHIDKNVIFTDYETPSMPDDFIFETIVNECIVQNDCKDVEAIIDIKKLMYRWKTVKDFSTTPGDIMIFERKLAFDKNWKLLKDFFSPETFFRGIIDVVDYVGGNTIIITDYKSSRKMLTKEKLKEDIQLKMYVLLVCNLLPRDSFNKIIIRIEYIRYNKIVEVEIDDIDAVVREATSWIDNSIKLIETEMLKTDGNSFQPKRNEFCDSCHIQELNLCPLFRKDMIDPISDPLEFIVNDVESCRKAWKRIEANKAENSKLLSKCKSFMETCELEVVVDKEAVLNFYPTNSRVYFTNKTVEALLGKGVDIRRIIHYMSMSDSSMKELLASEKIDFTPEEISEISKEKTTNSFKALTQKEISGEVAD